MQGDTIYLLGSGNAFEGLPWSMDAITGQLIIDVSDVDILGTDHAWAFEVRFKLV